MLSLERLNIVKQLHEKKEALIFIHSPFCGTCHVARKMLNTIEDLYQTELFYELNASLNPGLMQDYKIESVPCLLIMESGHVIEKVYAFHSVPHMLGKVSEYVKR
ncbi:thioredoxin family protein [Halobacillus shinanisalinarum]|uniref:Thioredoxin family protein n=1 Tax=Halobacillus shinanisalinarum TaxID=2932258 RepID=A0ABY4H1G0_9BACI|nr:thioredoxin family protein [Halobacillus shinanisalinarum]UOQ94271.1 thioredoxin family protein [Halobacillus shinanisalinarum]